MRFLERETHTHIRGFEPFHQLTQDSEIFLDTTRVKLTQAQGEGSEVWVFNSRLEN
jgi:hypothetical protein